VLFHRVLAPLLLAGLLPTPRAGAAEPRIPTPDETRREFLAVCEELRNSANPYFGTAQVAQLETLLSRPSDDPETVPFLLSRLARQHLRLGRPALATQLLNDALRLSAERDLEVRHQLQLLGELGVAFLRVGEVANCVDLHGPAMCIFPIGEAGRHRDPEAALLSLRAFKGVLAGVPDNDLVKWLANVAAMTAGEYPEALAEDQRVAPERLRSAADVGRFPEVAHEVGLVIKDLAGGALVDDFDGDGWLDVVTSSQEPCTPLRFFRNDGRGGFVDRSREARLDGQLGGLHLVHADYDGDGDLDILVLRGAWMGRQGRIRNSLLRNDGVGADGQVTFSDVTFAAGLAEPAYPTQTAAWADYDLDGDLDLYVGNEAEAAAAAGLDDPTRVRIGGDATVYPSQLFRNDGPSPSGTVTFTDVARQAGVENLRFTKGVSWGDYDGDGDPDLYVSNLGPNRLYRNDGAGEDGTVTFTDVAPALGVTEPEERSFATWWFDYDNDGDLDLFVADYNANTTDIARYYLGREVDAGRPRLYRNDGGRFEDVGARLGLTAPAMPMGANFGDLDNDGWLDFYLGTGLPLYEGLMPNLMYRNDGGRRFVDVTFSGGFGHLQKGHGVAFADLDHDGDQDVFEQMGGAYPGDAYFSALYRNPGHGHAWVKLRLAGVRSNTSAIGTRVKLVLDAPGGAREIHRTVGTGGSFGGSPLRLEIGLGDATAIRRLEVFWPASGERQVFTDVAIERFYEVREGESELRALDHPTVRPEPPRR